ncbi:MAG: hypothetical protein Q7T82_03215 [Armatimonadota bacterium]|nr:hypothetical protein [Armatimonadota bacterium]
MRRLLWKEFREKWLWFPALTLSLVGPTAFGKSLMFFGDEPSPWFAASMGVALLLGAASHSREIAGEAASFLRSRPISWKKATLAKIPISLVTIVTASFIAAVVFRLRCPSDYVALVTAGQLWRGACFTVLTLGCTYLAGFVCSIALPGVLGGVLTFLAVAIPAALQGMIYEASFKNTTVAWSAYAWVLGAVIACLAIVRFGLTLPLKQRIKRFAAVLAAIVAIGVVLDFASPHKPNLVILPGFAALSLSPDGNYALAEVTGVRFFQPRMIEHVIVSTTTGERGRFRLPPDYYAEDPRWTSNSVLYAVRQNRLWVARLADGKVIVRSLKLGGHSKEYYVQGGDLVSPAGRFLALYRNFPSHSWQIEIFDMEGVRQVGRYYEAYVPWWQSNTEIGYVDAKGERHIVNVLNGREVK